jgi:hypothetical protein
VQQFIDFEMSAAVTGWISLGFSARSPLMSGCDMYTGWINDNGADCHV